MKREVENLFHELADLPSGQREAYLQSRQVSDEVRAEVEVLLRFDSGTGDGSLSGYVVSSAQRSLLDNLEPNPRCGPYRLLRVLGRGGMGSVYLAERADGEVEQRVAIKIIGQHRFEPAFVDRFLRERQILATLSHPGIARLLDAGRTGDGQPYLAMEYVDGVPIDAYASKLDLRGKLALFLKTCEAVSYAHRNLIIHRDLKPSNILVESSGELKLLDFGIARMLDASMDRTLTQERILTPAFASPEQVRGTAEATTSDIYSLGAVLYQLLTGQSPHTISTSSQQAIELAVCLTEPAAPSRVNAAIPKDLDFIILKALRKEPEERYGSADALADDIRAFLESRPVRARRGNAWYASRKFLRRHWVPMAAAAAIVCSLAAGLLVANRERAIAQRHFLEVRQLANKLFDIDALARQLPGSTKTRQLIVDTSLEYLGRLAADARGDPDLSLEVGNAYMRVARVQGVPIGPTLGQLDRAGQNLQIADGFLRSVLQAQPHNRTAMFRAAQIAHDRMLLAGFNNRPDEGLLFADASAQWLEKFQAGIGDKSEDSAILNTYLNVANRYVSARRFDKALRLTGRAVELSRTFDFPAYRGTLQWVKAKVFQRQGNLEEALSAIQDSVALLGPGGKTVGHGQMTNLSQALVYQGKILGDESGVSLGRPEEAVKALERSWRLADGFVHQDSNDHTDRGTLAMAGIPLAGTLRGVDEARSLAVYDHTLSHLADIKDDVHLQTYVVRLLAGSSYPLRRLGRPAEARQRLDDAFQRLRVLNYYPVDKVDPGGEAAEALQALADHEADTGNIPHALRLYQELLDLIAAAKPEPETNLDDATELSNLYAAMAAVERRAGHAGLAAALNARRLGLWRLWERKLPGNAYVLRQIASKASR
ncbi:MAG: protein kinase domain-containing protein [Bryobacteraceae bacterium]